jgi:PAS domain S-box-containing protein
MENNPSDSPHGQEPRAWLRYGSAVFFVGVATALRAAFDKFLGEAHPFPFFLAAVAVAAWCGGIGPALLALILGYISADWFFIEPRYRLAGLSDLGIFSATVYGFTALVVSLAVNTAQAASRRERQRASQLCNERERFRVTLSSIGDAVIATDPRGLVTFMNPAAEKITGWTQQEMHGQPLGKCFQIRNELTTQPVDDPVAKVLRDGIIVGLANHTVLIAKDGREIPIDDSAAPIFDPAGEMLGAVMVFRDVSEQRAAEVSRRRLAAIVEDSDDAIISKNLDGVITTFNKAAERVFGYSAAEVVGQPITILIPADRQNEEPEILARLRRGEGVEHFETVRKAKDGRALNISLSISPIKDAQGNVIGASKIARDITERKHVEQALRETGARNTAILESALDAIIVIDHESKVLEFNPSAEKIFGFSRSQIIGRPMAEFIIPQRLRARHYQGLAHYLATGQGPVLRKRLELTALRSNGQEFPCELAILPIPGPNPPTFTGFLRDLTEVKRNQEALQQAQDDLLKANRSLESKVQQRTASLNQSLKSMETVLYTIAHDLRSPNRAMEGFAQLLSREYASQLDDTGRSYIKRISDAALRNDGLICDLLEFGRLAHAEMPMGNIDLGGIVQRVLQDLQEQIHAKNAIIEPGDKWPVVWANDSVLNQIITNLLTNALKFVAPNSRPRIRIWAQPSSRTREGHNHSGRLPGKSNDGAPAEAVRLCVQDNGIGIPADMHGRLFQPFQRGTADPKYQGTGMGLAIVQKGAERVGGKVGFTSTPGQGTSFWVELLPAHPVEPSVHEPSDIASHR